MTQDWFEVVTGGELRQCDVLRRVPVPIISSLPSLVEPLNSERLREEPLTDAEWGLTDLVILSQSCDLEKPRALTSVLTARLERWVDYTTANRWNLDYRLRMQDDVQKGRIMHLALLPERDESPVSEWSVVNFRELYTLPKQYLEESARKHPNRLRLTPPHREAVAQAFARYFMRVALEDDLSRFRKWSPPTTEELASPE